MQVKTTAPPVGLMQRSRRVVRPANSWARAAAAAIALTGLTAVIAMVARAPLSRSTPIDARSADAPVTALLVLTVGAGIVALTALVVVMWPGRRRRGDDDPEFEREVPEIHWLWKVLAILLPFALGAALVAAALLGLKTVNRSAVNTSTATPNPRVTTTTFSSRPRTAGKGFTAPSWLPRTALGIVLLAVAVGAWLLWRWWREPIATAASETTATGAAIQAAMAALDAVDDPRTAVIAAYVAMQQVLATHGLARSPAEAPREYLQRVLVASSATEEATTLTGLFEEARFSTHPVSEGLRERALSALGSLRAGVQTDGVR